VDEKENQSSAKFSGSSQNHQFPINSYRNIKNCGGKINIEPRGSRGTSSKNINKDQNNSLMINTDSLGSKKFNNKLQEPNQLLCNESCEIKNKGLNLVSKIPVSKGLNKSLLKSNNVALPLKSIRIVESDDHDNKAELNKTFTLGKVDADDLNAKKKVNSNTSKRMSFRDSSKESTRSQPVFKRLTMSVVTSKSNFKSMAELLKDFEKKTRIYSPSANKPKVKRRVTRPISPKLTAINRNRVACLSSREQEAEKMKLHQFKATPFNRKLYDSKFNSGVSRVYPKRVTKPKNLVFHSDLRIKSRKSTFSGFN